MESSPPLRLQASENDVLPTSKLLDIGEQRRLVNEAVEKKNAFIQWSEEKYPDLFEESKHKTAREKLLESPSKNLLKSALVTTGLANLGWATIGAESDNVFRDTMAFWYASFAAPVLEELIFRSKKIPNFIMSVGDKIGLPITQDRARVATNVLFSLGHMSPIFDAKTNILQVATAFGIAATAQKISNERGLAASTAFHSIYNATTLIGNFIERDFRDESFLSENNFKEYQLASKLNQGAHTVALIGLGIVGLKELIEDRHYQKLRESYNVESGKVEGIDHGKIEQAAKKLLAMPSTDGYKFETGVELAYMESALNMPDILIDSMTPDEYARTQVHNMVMETWKDPKTLPHRLEKANSYITEQIAKRKTI